MGISYINQLSHHHHHRQNNHEFQPNDDAFIIVKNFKNYNLLKTNNFSTIPNSNYINNMGIISGAAYYGYSNIANSFMDLSPLLPFGMLLVISIVISILILFRRWPGIVCSIVAGCLTSIFIYLMTIALRDDKLTYE